MIISDSLNRVAKSLIGDPLTKKIFGVGVIMLVLQGLALCCGYILQLLLARWLGEIEYGKYCYALSWSGLLGILATLGLPTAALRFVPQYISEAHWGMLQGFLSKGRQWLFVMGLSISLGVSALIIFGHIGARYFNCLIVAAWLVPTGALIGFHVEFLRAMQKILSAFLLPQLGFPLFLLLVAGFLYYFKNSLNAVDVLILTIFSNIMILAVQWLLISHRRPKESIGVTAEFNRENWLGVGMPLLAINLFNLLMGQTDILVIGSLMGPGEAGIYSIAAKLAGLVSFVLVAMNTLAAPVYAALYSEGKIMEMQRVSTRLAHIMFWPSLAIALFLLIFSTPLLELFGSRYIEGKTVLFILIAGQLFNVASGSVGYLTDLTGLQFQGAIVRGIGAALNLILTFLIVPLAGMVGAAIVTAGCLIFWNLCLYRIVSKKHKVKPAIWAAF